MVSALGEYLNYSVIASENSCFREAEPDPGTKTDPAWVGVLRQESGLFLRGKTVIIEVLKVAKTGQSWPIMTMSLVVKCESWPVARLATLLTFF